MRDYKNVKVPRKYQTAQTRVSAKRVDAGRSTRRRGGGAAAWKKLFLNILGLAILAGCSWAGWHGYRFFTQSELFQVSAVDVKGIRRLSDADLKAIVGPFTGQNIFRADLEAAARRARAHSWIREVRIHRALPNRISMNVAERIPDMVLETAAGRYLMDSETVVLERIAKDAFPEKLPTIAVRDYRAHPGEPVVSEGAAEALVLLAEIRTRGGWDPAGVTITADSPETLSITYADHVFKIGNGRYAEKLRRLGEIMNDVKQRGVQFAYVDLRPENQAAVMPANGKSPSQSSQAAQKRR